MTKKTDEKRERIIDLLVNKAALKQDVAHFSETVLADLKDVVEEELTELRKSVNDSRVRLTFTEKGKFEFRISVGSDTLVFQLHSNIFRFDDNHPIWDTPYLKQNGANGYFAIINIYNFLAESFEQNRYNDVGYLIGRLLINHEHHFVVEGQGNLDDLNKDLGKKKLTKTYLRQIVQSAMCFAIEFDLVTMPYDNIQPITIAQIEEISSDLHVSTGKRLGFKFSAEDKDVF